MITIYYTSFEEPLPPNTFNEYLHSLPVEMQNKITRYRKWEDAHASLLGKLLLKRGLQEMQIFRDLANLKYTSYDRPYFDDDIDFNISHSGNYVVCAFCTTARIGIDIEQVKAIDIECYQSIFHEEEWFNIMTSTNRFYTFFHYWTAKESIVKAQGNGLNIPLKNVHIKEGKGMIHESIWYCDKITITADYILQVASDKKPADIRIQKICF